MRLPLCFALALTAFSLTSTQLLAEDDLSAALYGPSIGAQGLASLVLANGSIRYSLVVNGVGIPTAASIRDGADVVVLDLSPTFNNGSASGSAAASLALLEELRGAPADYRVVVEGGTGTAEGPLLRAFPTGLIFADGFESGSTARWSQTVPSPSPAPAFAKAAFPATVPALENRPVPRLETDSPVYGPGVGLTAPELFLELDGYTYAQPVTLFLLWQDRVGGTTLHYNLHAQAFGAEARDLLGHAAATPARVLLGNFFDLPLFGVSGVFGLLPAEIPIATGQYQFILEIRDADGTAVLARSNAMYNHVDGVSTRSGFLTEDETWTADQAWRMTAPVRVLSPAKLTIEPGTVVLGDGAGEALLDIRPGAAIDADGTAMSPIVFTSTRRRRVRRPGNWGGVILSGTAPVNEISPLGQGGSGTFGGANSTDSSGILRYVRIEYCGQLFSGQSRVSGLALQGVGSMTEIDHVQVHRCADDGVEVLGGTVDLKYLLISDAEDDALDWELGWTGRLQHLVVVQRFEEHDHALEGESNGDTPDALPRSKPRIANATFLGNGPVFDAYPYVYTNDALVLRRGSGMDLTHGLVLDFADLAIDTSVSQPPSYADLTIRNSVFWNNALGTTDDTTLQTHLDDAANANRFLDDPLVANGHHVLVPDLSALAGSVLRGLGALPTSFTDDPFFDAVTHGGGVDPDDPWIDDGWTSFVDD